MLSQMVGGVLRKSPCFQPVGGVLDAWHGYPFWDPIALDEHRKYGR